LIQPPIHLTLPLVERGVNRFPGFAKEFADVASASPFTVFLCGPTLSDGTPRASARLRQSIKDALERENFRVVLGEDESITDPEIKSIGINLQDGELEFIIQHCNAIVIIADSVGSFCELGLFSWHLSHTEGKIKNTDFILLINKKFANTSSYLNDGPAAAVNAKGRLDFINFSKYDPQHVVTKLRATRGVVTVDRRGRPKKAAS
jgi:hypothetical protein